MKKIQIVIADDHVLIRDGIKALLQSIEEFEVVGEAADGEELIKLIDTLNPEIVLLDITMPKKTGIEVISEVKQYNHTVKFIMLSMHDNPEYVLKSVQAGALSYLLKNTDHEEIIKAVKAVSIGQKYFSPDIYSIILNGLANPDIIKGSQLSDSLTKREKEILKEVSMGLSTKLIADKLHISVRTVETHRINLMKKMQVHNSAELIKKAMDLNII
ncbi:response regulator transcription factor [uncultured Cytophaga sp.]|uniref:response regulator n=1 Tax=uncultured Cytophaga sp. TaxID=160238 RepID=UPI0026078469|nr:response regulator transcription factor [uncultured Cytophaga sp.]